jgi:hypothetical protein
MLARSGSSARVPLAVGATAVLLIVAALALRENASTPVAASPTAIASVGATSPSSPTPSAASSATPSSAPTSSASGALGTGPLTGNWIFVGKRIADRALPRATIEIWGVPLGDGSPRLAYAYSVATAGAPEAAFDNAPYLRRQFSPDGKQLVLSVDGELVIVELETGLARALGVAGAFPAWSKDGSLIAFVHPAPVGEVVPPPNVVAVVARTGGTPRDLINTATPPQSAEWSPDGRSLLVPTTNGLALVEVSTAQVLRTFDHVGPGGSSVAHWRGASPQVALAQSACTQGNARIARAADAAANEQTVVESGACGSVQLRDPRWNPTGSADLLYVRAKVAPGIEASDYVVHLVDGSGRDTTTPLRAYEATWSWNGAQIVYVVKAEGAPFGTVLAAATRANLGLQRELLRAGVGALFFTVASVSY